MLKVGIDAASFYTPRYFLDLKTLAKARGVETDKFYQGLGQRKMAVCPPGEDIVTMSANAGQKALSYVNTDDVELLLFATESGVDQSKAAGIFVHELLGLPSRCRVIELKQACYSGTAALRLALPYIMARPQAKVLLIAADVAKYGLNTTGESSQGGGAVAMVLSVNPRLLAVDQEAGFVVEDVMDFWRPNYRETALVEGKFSCDMYFKLLHETWLQYQATTGRRFDNHCRICYHVPIPRLAEKAHLKLARWSGVHASDESLLEQVEPSLHYARQAGNCYAASLFLSLISLLENATFNLGGERIGFYSYGSGAMAEFFSGTVQTTYKQVLPTAYHHSLISERFELDQQEYENFFNFRYPEDGSRFITPCYQTGHFRLTKVDQHKRIYEAVAKGLKVVQESEKMLAERVS